MADASKNLNAPKQFRFKLFNISDLKMDWKKHKELHEKSAKKNQHKRHHKKKVNHETKKSSESDSNEEKAKDQPDN